jgi:hypothetical protein
MTEQERQKIKAELIESGLWGVSEPGDPTTDIHDAMTLILLLRRDGPLPIVVIGSGIDGITQKVDDCAALPLIATTGA